MDISEIIKDAAIVSETTTFEEALAAMEANKTNTLLVVDEAGNLTGDVSVTNILEAIVPENLNGDQVMEHFSSDEGIRAAIQAAKDKPVSEFMNPDIVTLRADESMISVIATAIAHGRAQVPVVDHDGNPIGIVSRRGLKHILQKFAN